MESVVESGFSSIPMRLFKGVGSVGRSRGVTVGVLGVRLWKSVVAGGAGVAGTDNGTGVAAVGVGVFSVVA